MDKQEQPLPVLSRVALRRFRQALDQIDPVDAERLTARIIARDRKPRVEVARFGSAI
jgi:hypothetical protein